ncbi:MAG: helix-turn-helix transcriptional regulator, partial [Chloroflexi bacterium]
MLRYTEKGARYTFDPFGERDATVSKRARPAAARERAQAAPVGGLVRQARLAAGLTQAELAGAEMTKALISHIEHGRVRPSLRTLHVIAPRL